VSKSALGKFDVVSVFIAWVLLISFFSVLAYMKAFAHPDSSAAIIVYLFGAFLFAALCHFILSYFNRCPHCRKCLTIQGFKSPHPASSGSWNKVVWHWFSGSIVCIHCGQKVDTNGL
jgi:hypothetical protein